MISGLVTLRHPSDSLTIFLSKIKIRMSPSDAMNVSICHRWWFLIVVVIISLSVMRNLDEIINVDIQEEHQVIEKWQTFFTKRAKLVICFPLKGQVQSKKYKKYRHYYYYSVYVMSILESIQFHNGTGRRPIPIRKFRNGMGSPSIQKWNASQARMCFWKPFIVVYLSYLGHPDPKLLSDVYLTMT